MSIVDVFGLRHRVRSVEESKYPRWYPPPVNRFRSPCGYSICDETKVEFDRTDITCLGCIHADVS